MLTEFIVGQNYTNDQISVSLSVENLGGIRPAIDKNKDVRHIAIMTKLHDQYKSIADNPYHDRIEGDVLTYTGQGRSGDQSLTGRNKRITEQYEKPVPLLCFANSARQTYTFRGLLQLLRHYHELQVDSSKKLRKVLVYEFRVHPEIQVVPIGVAKDLTASFLPDRTLNSSLEIEQEIIVPEPDTSTLPEPVLYEVEEIRSHLLSIDPYRFEHVLKGIVEKIGFRDVSVTPPSKDGGIDLNAYVSDENLFFANTHMQFQAKRWRHSVGSGEINSFRGALSSTAKGVFVTTSHFTKAAIQEARHSGKPSIALIDGFSLASLIRQHHLHDEISSDSRNE